MATFEQIRDQLAKDSTALEQAQREQFMAREQAKKSVEGLNNLGRTFQPNDQESIRNQAKLKERLDRNNERYNHLNGLASDINGRLSDLWQTFLPFTDPRENIKRLNDRVPILMLPVRIETRFKKINTSGTPVEMQQLWVRVYPDDCSIDNFEPDISETEATNARKFWAGYWAAGGVIENEKSAWRNFVGAHGAGRAGYIIQKYRPLNEASAPVKVPAPAEEVILTIADNMELNASSRLALESYWKAIWKADGEPVQTDNAWNDLVIAAGNEDKANQLRRDYRPGNLSERPPTLPKSQADVRVVFVDFPTEDDFPTKRFSWSRPATAKLLPERFVVLAYRNGELVHQELGNLIPTDLQIGPDPGNEKQWQKDKEKGTIDWGNKLDWMVDFDKAVEQGMGFKINLSAADVAAGFDRLFVLGVRIAYDAERGQTELGALLEQHSHSKSGLALLPQGVATNNTENGDSFFLRTDDVDDSFEVFLKNKNQFEPENNPILKRDGQILAESLGVPLSVFQKTPNAGQTDQCEARAMNTALWPVTFGHFMNTEMDRVFTEGDERFVRQFFTRQVSGRGPVPALRIGKQPYGILPVSPFKRLSWVRQVADTPSNTTHVALQNSRLWPLYSLLLKIEETWRALSNKVSWVGKPPQAGGPDAHQILLDILGLHPTSEEYFYRYAHTIDYLYNFYQILELGGHFVKLSKDGKYTLDALSLLKQLGYDDEPPVILEKVFFGKQQALGRFLIDDRPLSETEVIRTYTTDPALAPTAASRNYLQWMREAVNTDMENLRLQKGFFNNTPPSALLYILLRTAFLQGYHKTSLNIRYAAKQLDDITFKAALKETPFINVTEQKTVTESRWETLYSPVSVQEPKLMKDHIRLNLHELEEASQLREQIEALKHLENAPTARLERLLAEHIDCCAYRYDAWRMGLQAVQLGLMRQNQQQDSRGIYIGAYGWVENLRPDPRVLSPVELPSDLKDFFEQDNRQPLLSDNTNGGHIMAPSINHAITAAVLRNGFKNNAAPGDPDALAVDLSSERVRQALSILEGMRNGQKLGALLGYRLERILHDRDDNLELDRFIFPLRKAFPLVANRIKKTVKQDVGISAVEARNVPDGLALVKHVTETGPMIYPYGKAGILPTTTTAAERSALDVAVKHIVDLRDAVADLAIAESVHQAVMGNHERTAANLDGYAGASVPTEPEVVRTPRSGTALTHRIGIHFDPAAIAPPGSNPRAMAEPGVQRWLEKILPEPQNIACVVEFLPRNAANTTTLTIDAAQLGLQVSDLLYLQATERRQSMSVLDDLLLAHVVGTQDIHPGSGITILYTTPVLNKISLFEINPLLESVSTVLLSARPLAATDVLPPAEASRDYATEPSLPEARVTSVRTSLSVFLTNDVTPLLNDLQSRFDPLPVQEAFLIQNIDQFILRLRATTGPASLFGLRNSGIADAWDTRQQIFTALINRIKNYANSWDLRITEFDDLITEYQTAAVDQQKDLLLRAERTLSVTSTDPTTIVDLETFRLSLQTTTKVAFANRLTQIRALVSANGQALSALIAAAEALDNSAFTSISLNLSDEKQSVVLLADKIRLQVQALQTVLQKRLDTADGFLAGLPTAADANARVSLLLSAGQALLGEDFRLFPAFTLHNEHGNEWANAFADRDRLLQFAKASTPFPTDDWLYGVARVRDKMRHYENILMLSQAFERTAPELTPVQFPYVPAPETYNWLGMAFSNTMKMDTADPLLYTAHYVDPNFFNTAAPICGALVDEWTEVIPVRQETAGLAFHYDRPNNEAPQTWLLAMPAGFRGTWEWNDLVDCLHDTLDSARLRAVEPMHIDGTPYAAFLPAIIASTARRETSIFTNFALATDIKQVL